MDQQAPELSAEIPEFDLPLPRDRPMRSPVPPRALAISIGALVVALVAGTLSPEALRYYRALPWSLALIPALLLSYHRQWRGGTIALAVGMAVLALSPAIGFVLELPVGRWPFSVVVLSAYIAIALGGGWFSEVRRALEEVRRTQGQLRAAYAKLTESYEELQEAHLHMVRSNQLDATGQLAAGVAHEVKNPLMTLLIGIQYLKTYGKVEDEKVLGLLDDMWLAVKRADSVVRGLLDLSREREFVWKEHDPNELVERTLGLMKHDIDRHRIVLVREYEEELPPLVADGYRIQQVLINLIGNAIDVMPNGGTITVRTHGADLQGSMGGEGTGGGTGARVDGIAIVIEDTGPGIPAHVLDRVFEAFFTTKGKEHGTGLGLAVSQRLVRMHGGTLGLENLPSGARATVLLPLQPEGVERGGEETDSGG